MGVRGVVEGKESDKERGTGDLLYEGISHVTLASPDTLYDRQSPLALCCTALEGPLVLRYAVECPVTRG